MGGEGALEVVEGGGGRKKKNRQVFEGYRKREIKYHN